jgi:hypothetical protein
VAFIAEPVLCNHSVQLDQPTERMVHQDDFNIRFERRYLRVAQLAVCQSEIAVIAYLSIRISGSIPCRKDRRVEPKDGYCLVREVERLRVTVRAFPWDVSDVSADKIRIRPERLKHFGSIVSVVQ